MAKEARFSKGYLSSNWGSLPEDLLNSIVEKLFYLPDYIRFSAVCKSWNSIASNHKEKRIELSNNNHQLPWLLTRFWSDDDDDDEDDAMFSLYNYTAQLISNIRVRIPQDCTPYCYGSSHGWLVFFMENMSSLILSNPLSGSTICLPPLEGNIFMVANKQVILSRNPSLGSFEVLAYASFYNYADLAYLRYGDEFWTYSQQISSFYNRSFAFYKNRILRASSSGQIDSIDVLGDTTFRLIKIREIVAADINCMCYSVCYLVETTKSDLLMVLRRSDCICGRICKKYKVFKLVELDGKFKRVSVSNLDGHCLFLGKSSPISVLASNYPCCNANWIYYSFYDWQSLENYKVEEFNLEDETVKEDRSSDTVYTSCWVLPSTNN